MVIAKIFLRSSFLVSLTFAYDLPIEDSEDGPPNLYLNQNFYGFVIDEDSKEVIGDKPWFIEFYSPKCPHCQDLLPIWTELHVKH